MSSHNRHLPTLPKTEKEPASLPSLNLSEVNLNAPTRELPNLKVSSLPTPTKDTAETDTPTTPQDQKPKRSRSKRTPDQVNNTGTGDQLTASQKKLVGQLAGLYSTVGMLVGSVDTYSGLVLVGASTARAEEMVRAARHHKQWLDTLEKLVQGNDYIGLIIGHGMMAYAILAHFKRVPDTPLIAAMGLSESQVLAGAQAMVEDQLRMQSNGSHGTTNNLHTTGDQTALFER